ncbi:retrovirus-related pol polyprotein from transposon TNT 1-94 [Tanacetum coccineum]
MDKFIISSAVYNVWRERNRRSFQNVSSSDEEVTRNIIDNITDMLKSIKVKKSSEVLTMAQQWNLKIMYHKPSDATYSVVIIYSDDVDAIMLHSIFVGNVASCGDMVLELKDNAVPVVQSNVSSVTNDAYMMIYNDMCEPHAQSVSKTTRNIVVDNSLTAELETYKEQVELYERRARFELTEREQKIDEQLRIVITDRNIKEENLKKELHSVKLQLASTINHNKSMVEEVTSLKKDFKQKENKYLEEFLDMKALKEKVEDRLYKQDQSLQTVHMLCKPKPYYNELNKVAIGYKNPLCLTRAKQVQPALYNGYEIVKNNHVPAIVHNTEDTLEIAEITRRKMHDKMKDPECVTHKVKIAPPDYSKENYLATFTPQKQLTPEQIFWSQDIIKMKAEALKEQTTASRPTKALTVYPPNTPATLVPRVLPTKSQVKINIFALIQLFSDFEKTCNKRITPTGLTEGERGFEQTKACYLTEVIPFFKTLKEHFEGIQKALTKEVKEMKEIFEELEAEVDQHVVDRKHDEIERKNLLIANDNLIADCLFKDVFHVATNSELNVSSFTEMHDAHTSLKARCLELEVELSNLRDKIQKDNHDELIKRFSNLEIVEEAKAERPLDSSLASACCYTKHSQELLEYVIGTYLKSLNTRDNKHASTSLPKKKQVTFEEQCVMSKSNTHKPVELLNCQKTNVPMPPSTGVNSCTDASRSQPRSNTKKNRILPAKSVNMKKVEEPPRTIKSSLKTTNRVDSSISSKRTVINSNSHSVCQTCNKCLIYANHDMRVVTYLHFVNATPSVKNVVRKAKQVLKPKQVKQVWKPTSNILTTVGYQWMPTERTFTLGEHCPLTRLTKPNKVSAIVVQIVLWYLDSGYSKHMTGDRSRLKNFVKKFIGTVRFGNDHFGAIMGYGDYVIGESVISSVYYVEGLGHNLFFVGQFCNSNLEVAFRKHSCYVRDTNGVELIKGSHGSNLYTISIEDMLKSSPICLLSKASRNKLWLWHRCLNHLNFGTINDLARKDLVRGLPRLKFEKDHLCSTCQLGKSKRHTHKPKTENTNLEVLNTLHMDLCGPMRVQTINGKKYILVVIKFLKQIQVGLNKTVRNICTNNGTEFVNKDLTDYYERVGIFHQKTVPRTPRQNDVVERQNRTLVEAARTMLIFSKAPMILWAEAVATACYTQNRSLIHTRHCKTPYELVHDKKPDLTFFRIFGALCYPTNDSEDLGKLQLIADIGIFVGYAPSRKGTASTFLTPGQISSSLVPNPVPVAPYVPLTNKDLEILFQPMFDEYLEPPRVKRPVPPVPAAQVPVNSTGTPSSTTIDQDAHSPSHLSSSSAFQSPSLHQGIAAESPLMKDNPFAPIDNDHFINIFALEPRSEASSSGDLSSTESPYVSQTLHHLRKWSKDHPLDNIIGNPSRPVSTRKQLATDALWCLYNSVLSKVEPKNFKSAITKDCWFQAMQDKIYKFDRLPQVWELVPQPDCVMIIALKWIYKVKLDEYGDVLKTRHGWWPRDIDKRKALISRNHLHRLHTSRL